MKLDVSEQRQFHDCYCSSTPAHFARRPTASAVSLPGSIRPDRAKLFARIDLNSLMPLQEPTEETFTGDLNSEADAFSSPWHKKTVFHELESFLSSPSFKAQRSEDLLLLFQLALTVLINSITQRNNSTRASHRFCRPLSFAGPSGRKFICEQRDSMSPPSSI